ncbi:protein FRA10AC1-like [Babylonia areolata]|uniref:protein FRA10AC1-like n=1 Tax=Babylonia areolata TaxID=304850 RepID=UPI003FD34427
MAEKIDFTEIAVAGYNSDFDSDAETRKRKLQDESLLPTKKKKSDGVPSYQEMEQQYTKEEGKIHRLHYLSMSAFDRHKQFVNNYLLYFGGNLKDFKRDTSKDRNDMDVIRENHQFLWDEDDDTSETWEKALAKKYYDKLFKEYCLADLSRYKENKVGMRWRTENEVVEGKGQFICGSKKCPEKEGLRSWEVNFAYVEHGEKKNALVKLRLCPDCSYRLNYHHKRKEVLPPKTKQERKRDKRHKKHKKHKKGRRGGSSDEEQNTEGEPSGQSQRGSEKDDKPQAEETNVWSGPAKITEEKSREEEFEDYFADMFL